VGRRGPAAAAKTSALIRSSVSSRITLRSVSVSSLTAWACQAAVRRSRANCLASRSRSR
jgi:hypothetical protein